MRTAEETEKFGAEGATAPRITLEYIKSQIEVVSYTTAERAMANAASTQYVGKTRPNPEHMSAVTICVMVLKSGFVVLGHSAPMSLDNYNAQKGQELAYDRCIMQLWPMFAFARLQGPS